MVAQRQHHLDSLPGYATSFIGRVAEQADLVRLLVDPEIHLVTLIGPGGVGKTRLAIETVRRHSKRLQELFPDGALFVDMSPVASADRALATLAAALELPETAESELKEAVSEALANREMLLILDNLEHIVEGGALLAAIARSCTGVKLLATSRTPLRVSGEQRYTVPLLSADDGEAGAAASADALSLYEARAKEVVPGFVLDDRSLPVVRKICQKLDGLPLAIELAVPRLRVISSEALLARLENRLQVLDRGPVDAISRHRTLDATIDWSAQFLSPELLWIFLRLSIVPDTFSFDAVERIGGSVNALDDMASLVDQALVQPIVSDSSEEPRFRMLATVREYATRRLQDSERSSEARDALIDYCVVLVERTEPLLTGPEVSKWVTKLAAEYQSTRLALELSIPDLERDEPIRALASLWRFSFMHGTLNEHRGWIDQTLACRTHAVTDLWARFYFSAGIVAESQHDYAAGLRWIEQSLEIAEALGDTDLQAKCWLELGHISGDTGGFERALDCYRKSAKLAKSTGNMRAEVVARCGLATVENRRGHDDEAARLYEEVIPLVRSLRDDLTWATLLGNYGVVLARQGKQVESRLAQEESLSLNKKIGNQVGVAMALINLHEISSGAGSYLTEALAIARDVNTAELTLSVLSNLAGDALARRDMKAAAGFVAEAIELALDTQMPVVVSEMLDHAAELISREDPARAVRLTAAAAKIRGEHEIHWTGRRGESQSGLVGRLKVSLGAVKYEAEIAAGSSAPIETILVEARAGLALLTLGVESKPSQRVESSAVLHDLTRREVDVLRQIAQGASDREIGNTLFISPKTANHHVTRILSKLGCTTRAAAAAIAVRNGIV